MRVFHWRAFVGAMVLVSMVAFGLHAVSRLPFWGSFLIVLFGVLVNGWLVTWEDEQPGGFNNPNDQ